MAGVYRGFCSMKQLRVLLLPLDGMLVHRRVTPAVCSRYPFIHLGGETQCGVEFFSKASATLRDFICLSWQIWSPVIADNIRGS